MATLLGEALEAALLSAKARPLDQAAVALVRRYVELMDGAAELADAADLIDPDNASQARQLAALRVKIEAHTVAADLGPKLLAALTALGMTLAGRKETKGPPPDVPTDPAAAALAQLQVERGAASRQR